MGRKDMTNRVGHISVLCGIVVVGLVGCHNGIAIERPYVSCEQCDLGWVSDTLPDVEADFWIHNPSKDTVLIADMLTDCDCTSVTASKSYIFPQDSTRITMTISMDSEYLLVEKAAWITLIPTDTVLRICTRYIRKMPEEEVLRLYPVSLSKDIRISANHVHSADSCPQSIDVVNLSDTCIRLSVQQPECASNISVYATESLNPGEKGSVLFFTEKNSPRCIMEKARFILESSDGGWVELFMH